MRKGQHDLNRPQAQEAGLSPRLDIREEKVARIERRHECAEKPG